MSKLKSIEPIWEEIHSQQEWGAISIRTCD